MAGRRVRWSSPAFPCLPQDGHQAEQKHLCCHGVSAPTTPVHHPMQPACLPMHPAARSIHGHLPASPYLRWGTVGHGQTPATSSRHIITRYWDHGAASLAFLSGWHGSPQQKTPSRLLRSWKDLFLFTLYELQEEARLSTGAAVRGAAGIHWLGCRHVAPAPRPAAAQPSVAFTP